MPPTDVPHRDSAIDDALLERLRRGESDAYEVVLDRYEASIYRFFYYSHGDREQALDQSGETFARLVASIRTLRGNAESFRAYLFGIARNVLRADRRQPRLAFDNPEALDTVADPASSQADRAAARESFDRALDAIGRFPCPLRQVLQLRFVEDLSIQEVAQALGLPINSVKSHIHRGRIRLRELLDPDSPAGESEATSKVESKRGSRS